MNKYIRLAVRNAACQMCRMHNQAEDYDRCVTAEGSHTARIMVVSKAPLGERNKKELLTYLTRAGFYPDDMVFASALKCRVWDIEAGAKEQKACKPYLQEEIDFVKPEWILTLGAEALFGVTGKKGVMKLRGHVLDHPSGAKVVPSIAPSMIYRTPSLKEGFEADLKYFMRLSSGVADDPMNKPQHKRLVMTKEDLRDLIAEMQKPTTRRASFDIEGSGFKEWVDDAKLVSIAFTLSDGSLDLSNATSWGVPLYHPESPFKSSWEKVLALLGRYFKRIPKTDAHNGKFDNRWLRQWGVKKYLTFDTMLAAHILDENRVKGLKPLAQQIFGVEPWGIDIISKKGVPWYTQYSIEEILEYNILDTWHTARLSTYFRPQLVAQPAVANLYLKVTMPLSETLTEVERAGIWMDRPLVEERWQETKETLDNIDRELDEWLPEGYDKSTVNWKPSNHLRWFLFDHMEFPVLDRGKSPEEGVLGAPSVSDGVLSRLAEIDDSGFIDLLRKRSHHQKNEGFFSAYDELLDEHDRIRTTFRIAGTTTGRTSSGKADQDKVTATRADRSFNAQNVPREEFVKGCFGAAPGWLWAEADYSQIELRIAAFIAQERQMLALYNAGVDIHTAMAIRITGKSKSQITSHHRTMAKSVNFGFLYGMGPDKYIETAWKNYGVKVTESEARAFRVAFFAEFPGLRKWHAQQRRLVKQFKRVQSPMGRIRHLPDIDSPRPDVSSSAERQAINSPVQAMASDMLLYSLHLIHTEFKRQGLRSRAIGTVHDSSNFELFIPEMSIALPIIKDTMENLPLSEEFGVNLNVPIISDIKLGTRWGKAKELTDEQIYNWTDEYATTLSG